MQDEQFNTVATPSRHKLTMQLLDHAIDTNHDHAYTARFTVQVKSHNLAIFIQVYHMHALYIKTSYHACSMGQSMTLTPVN